MRKLNWIVYVYAHFSEVKVYDPSADSTLPSVSKKRKFADEEEEDVKPKKIKVENGNELDLWFFNFFFTTC